MIGLRLLSIADQENPTDPNALKHAIEVAEKEPGDVLDLTTDWIAMHITLTAELPIPKFEALRRGISWDDESLENALMGGDLTNPSDPTARLLLPDDVKRIARKLKDFDEHRFRESYDEEMFEEYDVPLVPFPDLLAQFLSLKSFYVRAANDGRSIVIQLT